MNVFENIICGEIPCNKVHENNNFLAFHDISPQAPIHVLVIPKNTIKDFEEVPASIMAEMSIFIKEVTKKLGIDKAGYRLISNCGIDGGQEVPHLHFHILAGKKLGKLI